MMGPSRRHWNHALQKDRPAVAASIILLVPATASADYAHVVRPGETLTSIAATDGLSVSALAAANGLAPSAELVSGTVIQIPPQTAATSASTTTDTSAESSSATSTATVVSGSYIVATGRHADRDRWA